MSKVCILVHLLSSVSFFLGSVDAQRPCSDDTLDDTIRNFIRQTYRSDASRILGIGEIETESLDLFASCVARKRLFGLDNQFWIHQAVVSFNIPGDYSSNSGDAGYTGRLDVQCRLGYWLLTRSNQEPYLREPEGVCAQCDVRAHKPCTACLLSCESNEIPLADCTDCEEKEYKTQIVTYSQPAWKEHVRGSTDTTKQPDSQQLHSTIIVGTTNVVTHGAEIPEEEEATTGEGINTVKPTTKGYTTQEWRSTAQGSTTKVVTKGYTTRVVSGSPTAGETSTYNQITTKLINSTEVRLSTEEKNTMEPDKTTEPAQGTDSAHNSAMFSPLFTGPFEVTPSKGPATEVVTTDNDVATEKSTTEAEIVTTEAEIVATEPEIVTTEAEIIITKAVTTEAETATTEAEVVVTKARVFTTEVITSEPDVASTPDDTEVVVLPVDPNDNEGDQDDWDEDDNDVDDSKSADPEYCIDHEICYNGGESVCENGGDFLYCICQHGFTGTYCEQERSVAKVDDVPRGQSSFWDWKLSKYIIGGLGALTVIGLIMLTCMVVKCVKSGKEDRRRMEDYNAVGMETFIPPAPVVQTTLRGAAMDRGSSDVMDERSEEEFHLHESDDELGDSPVQIHRLHNYPDPEDDGLLHHAPTHRPGPSPDHYKVPTQNREYMNMNKQKGNFSPYMNGHNGDKIGPYMNGTANTYSHKLNDKNKDQYAHLNRSYSKNAQPQHNYLNLP